MLRTKNRNDLIKYRIELAYTVLQEARDQCQDGALEPDRKPTLLCRFSHVSSPVIK